MPPTTGELADRLGIELSTVEEALVSLAGTHQIALVPGSHSIRMALPFSGIQTDWVTETGGKKYWVIEYGTSLG